MTELTREQIESFLREGSAWCPSNNLTKSMARMALRTHDAEQRAQRAEAELEAVRQAVAADDDENTVSAVKESIAVVTDYARRLQRAEAECERLRDMLNRIASGPRRDSVTQCQMAAEALATPPPEGEPNLDEHPTDVSSMTRREYLESQGKTIDAPQTPEQAHGDALAENNNALYHLGFLLRSSNADHQSLRRCDEVIRPYLTASGAPEEVRRLVQELRTEADQHEQYRESLRGDNALRGLADDHWKCGTTKLTIANRLERALASAPAVCEWTPDDEGVYESACGESWVSPEGLSIDEISSVKYCHGCGRRIQIAAAPTDGRDQP